jgi:hypothetical protein
VQPTLIPLGELVQLGEPRSRRGVTICPLYPRRRPRASYLTLDEGLARGLGIREVSAVGAVAELLVTNPLDTSVLLYDGEELAGAKQDRILNVSVLVAARSELAIPVSCVERGRWRSTSPRFRAAPHAAAPDLRRRKSRGLAADPLARGAVQREVWAAVDAQHDRLRTESPTDAQAASYEQRGTDLAELGEAFPLEAGQAGAIVAIGRDGLCLDYVSRPEAFARLYEKLLRGYLLDAIDRPLRDEAGRTRIDVFLDAVASARVSSRPSEGLGEDRRLDGAGVFGCGLSLADELIQLSAFSARA